MTKGLDLLEALNDWYFASNSFHDLVVQFAIENCDHFTSGPGGEHSFLAHELQRQFAQQIEGHIQGFLDHHGATMEVLEEALEEHARTRDFEYHLRTRETTEFVVDLMLSLLQYDAFHRTMLRALAEEKRPEALAALQVMAEADVPGARAQLQTMIEERSLTQHLYDDLNESQSTMVSTDRRLPTEQMLQVIVPEGVAEGLQLIVTAPDGCAFTVTVPAGVTAGQAFEVAYNSSS